MAEREKIQDRFKLHEQKDRMVSFRDMSTYAGDEVEVVLPVYDWYDLGKPEFLTVTIEPLAGSQKHAAQLEVEAMESNDND
jgi:hypothetical protein